MTRPGQSMAIVLRMLLGLSLSVIIIIWLLSSLSCLASISFLASLPSVLDTRGSCSRDRDGINWQSCWQSSGGNVVSVTSSSSSSCSSAQ